ncbi:MAG TPA: NAD(P)H-dependent oxidoreductase [Candidatus Thermoplasmatota archaeon]|nr:NAD(P)H-dependent oxidoreductase [Candidatus Thermoplasmatota archaeon]
MTPAPPLRVVGLPGSLRSDSSTRKVVALALDGARELGAEVALLDLAGYDLPLCDARDDESTYPEGVHRLRADLRAAKGIILGTPEYHGDVSGVLKNALDLCGFEEFEGKMLGLVGVAGGRLAATHALDSLRHVGRSLHAWVVPEEAGVPQAGRAFGPDGNLTDPRLEARVKEVGRQVARFAMLHTMPESKAFVEAWERCWPNPGGIAR